MQGVLDCNLMSTAFCSCLMVECSIRHTALCSSGAVTRSDLAALNDLFCCLLIFC